MSFWRPSAWRWQNIFIPLLFLLLPVVIYGPHIVTDRLWHLDDHLLIDPIITANSWEHYRQLPIVDVAPLRDFSYWIDKQIWRFTGVTVFHLHNALLWGLIGLLVSKILALRLFSRRMAILVGLLVLVHPMFSLDIYWAAARKHLLAVFLTLLNTYYWCRMNHSSALAKGDLFRTTLLYLLALHAWPIVILWPCWALFYRWIILADLSNWRKTLWPQMKQDKFLVLLLLCVAFGMAAANWYYYPRTGVHSKFFGMSWISLAAFGQYFFSFIWPFKIAIGYPMATSQSLLGLCLEILFFYLCFKVLPWRLVLNLLLYYLCSLAIVTVNVSHIYVSDTYHTGGGWVLIALLILLLQKAIASLKKPRLAPHKVVFLSSLLSFLIIFFSGYDYQDQKNWSDDYHAYQTSYLRWPQDGSNLEFHLFNLLHPEREDHFQCPQAWRIFVEWMAVRQGKFSPPQLPILMSHLYLTKLANSAEPLDVKRACLAQLPANEQVQLTGLLLSIRAHDWPQAKAELAALKQIRLLPIFAAQLQRLEKIYLWHTRHP